MKREVRWQYTSDYWSNEWITMQPLLLSEEETFEDWLDEFIVNPAIDKHYFKHKGIYFITFGEHWRFTGEAYKEVQHEEKNLVRVDR